VEAIVNEMSVELDNPEITEVENEDAAPAQPNPRRLAMELTFPCILYVIV
jgi:hypothetical protein